MRLIADNGLQRCFYLHSEALRITKVGLHTSEEQRQTDNETCIPYSLESGPFGRLRRCCPTKLARREIESAEKDPINRRRKRRRKRSLTSSRSSSSFFAITPDLTAISLPTPSLQARAAATGGDARMLLPLPVLSQSRYYP